MKRTKRDYPHKVKFAAFVKVLRAIRSSKNEGQLQTSFCMLENYTAMFGLSKHHCKSYINRKKELNIK